ncbi:hypothetical protein NMG60_11014481 [Bertholletia excelsa]
MCSGYERKPSPTDTAMGSGDFATKEKVLGSLSVLLELSASDDLIGFRAAVEEEGHDLDKSSFWYGRRIGSKRMGFEERTPLLIAAMFGSKQVLSYIIETGRVDVNRACGSDGATALHCAVWGGSSSSPEVIKLLLDASATIDSVDANGNRPHDLVSLAPYSNLRRKMLENLLKGSNYNGEECVLGDQIFESMETQQNLQKFVPPKDGIEKKEYPVDLSLPDINNGIYGTDEFRMYMFKVKPCSRAYSHDWTECPFAHPGENARRRDPRKYHYSCVPCPEFRKGTCRQGDACEYAHGIFECWLHPAQYRTRLCKDETGCTRRVCFFAHKREELRPLYASTGSGMPSPRSFSNGASALDMASIGPLALSSPSLLSPSGASSPRSGSMWQNPPNIVPPTLQLLGSRLKTATNAREMDLEAEFVGFESHHRRQHQLMDRIADLHRLGGLKPTNLDDTFGSLDPAILPQLQGLSLDMTASPVQSPTGIQIRQNMNQQLCPNYPDSLSSSPVRSNPSFGMDPFREAAAAAFAKRSQSFIDRSAASSLFRLGSPISSATGRPSLLSDWRSPDGKLDWGIQKDELNKLRKSASFRLRSSNHGTAAPADEPDVSWVQSLVKEGPGVNFMPNECQSQQHDLNGGGSEMMPTWLEQLYAEQEQMVA